MSLFQPPYPPQLLQTFGNYIVQQDDSQRLGIFAPNGTEIWDINSSGDVFVAGTFTATSLATFDGGITGTGNTGTLTAGTGILGTANTWGALQTFGNDISFGGAVLNVTSLATNDVLQFNGTNWVNILPTSLGLVNSVANSDGTLTISPTTGAVVASLALGHANTWTALQTFGTDISFLGAQPSGTIASGNLLYYNGTNWIGQSLAAGTGISVSGTTVTNTGVTSLAAGTAISLSGSTGAVTVTNTGVTSAVAGDGVSVSAATGAVTFAAVLNGTTLLLGASGLSLNLGNANTWTATQTFPAGNFGDAFGLTSSEIGFFPYTNGTVLGQSMSFMTLWGTVDNVGGWIGENYASIQMGMFNRTAATQGALAASSWMMNLGLNQSGAVYTFVPTNYAIGVANSVNSAIRNTLDDGSGNMTIAGLITANGGISTGSQQNITWTNSSSGNVGNFIAVQFTDRFAMYPSSDSNLFTIENAALANLFSVNPTTSGTSSFKNTLDDGSGNMTVAGNFISTLNGGYVSAYNEQVLMFTGSASVNGNGGDAGISIQGRPRIGDWGQWLTIGEPNGTNSGYIIQIVGGGSGSGFGIRTGTSTGITAAPTIRNTLDDGTGAQTIAGLATFSAGITGTGNTGTLTAGTGILGTANTWTANQTFNNSVSVGAAQDGTQFFLTLDIVEVADATVTAYNSTILQISGSYYNGTSAVTETANLQTIAGASPYLLMSGMELYARFKPGNNLIASGTPTNTGGSGFSNGGTPDINILAVGPSFAPPGTGIRVITATFVEHNNGGSAAVGIALSTTTYVAGDTIVPTSTNPSAVAYAGSDNGSNQTFRVTCYAPCTYGTTYYVYIVCGGTGFTHYVESSDISVY